MSKPFYPGADDPDVRLPQKRMHPIEILVRDGNDENIKLLTGQWLTQYREKSSGLGFSLARLADGKYAVIAKADSDAAVVLEIFNDAGALHRSQLPLQLVRAVPAGADEVVRNQ